MSKVKIETLTPVHIGSGEFLRHNSDFVKYNYKSDLYLCVLNPRKILDLIGVERLSGWVSLIENGGDIKEYVSRVAGNVSPLEYSLRYFRSLTSVINLNDTLKECMHDGVGVPYIPGSSIKGAIRSAVVATLSENRDNLENLIIDKNVFSNKEKVNATKVESKLLGADPNSDVFRFIRVGDAYFDKGSEIAIRLINLNIRERESLIDSGKQQLVEAINKGVESVIQLKVDKEYYQWTQKNWNGKNLLGLLSDRMCDESLLFDLINKHTKKLLEEEQDYWQNVADADYIGAEPYIDNIKSMLNIAHSCKRGSECVLRIGHASGWRFITGAWTEDYDIFEDKIVPSARPGNHKYEGYDFPKSRRMGEKSEMLGFVKLTLI